MTTAAHRGDGPALQQLVWDRPVQARVRRRPEVVAREPHVATRYLKHALNVADARVVRDGRVHGVAGDRDDPLHDVLVRLVRVSRDDDVACASARPRWVCRHCPHNR